MANHKDEDCEELDRLADRLLPDIPIQRDSFLTALKIAWSHGYSQAMKEAIERSKKSLKLTLDKLND